ncbi:unnamed protein product [Durusdinium trenchii]|uniref:Uncharacterized protein n=1 Tax=Durusdinium trenchii TaxID=1381693 RepID=A0ABP0QLZ2_9DINO
MLHPILGDFHHRLLRMAWRRNCTTWRLAAVRCATFCCPCWPGSLQSDSPLRRAMQWLFLEVLTLESLTASLKIWLDVEAQLEKLKYIVESLNSQRAKRDAIKQQIFEYFLIQDERERHRLLQEEAAKHPFARNFVKGLLDNPAFNVRIVGQDFVVSL